MWYLKKKVYNEEVTTTFQLMWHLPLVCIAFGIHNMLHNAKMPLSATHNPYPASYHGLLPQTSLTFS